MTTQRRIALAVVTAVVFVARAAADPAAPEPAPAPEPTTPATTAPTVTTTPPGNGFWHLTAPWHLITDSDKNFYLPPAYVLDEPTWAIREAEMKRLQDVETRLTVENKTMKTSTSGWQPGWITVISVFAVGVAGGWYAREKL